MGIIQLYSNKHTMMAMATTSIMVTQGTMNIQFHQSTIQGWHLDVVLLYAVLAYLFICIANMEEGLKKI